MRNHYWSCSKFADWLRGTAKPNAETSDGWRVWRKTAEAAHPIRYWLADEGLDLVQKAIYWPTDQLYSIKYYINNRWVTGTHRLTAHPRDIQPGAWQDVGYRFLPCLFNELVNYVEVELAWWHIAWSDAAEKQKYQAPFWATGWWRWRTWRCPAAGLDNLRWQMELTNEGWCQEDHPDFGKPAPQAASAREIYELYQWWTVKRPQRPDPYDVSGWSAYCEQRRLADPDDWITGADKEDTGPMLKIIDDLEQQFDQEDEDMLIRLIKIRRALWT